MSDPEQLPPLRLAREQDPEDLVRRIEREQRAAATQTESLLEDSIAPFKVGSVPYLNAVPLTRGIEHQILLLPPSQLAVKLRAGELDAALLSITEVLLNDCYDILDGAAVASLGEVKSVFLAHRRPIAEITEVQCDPASLTSVELLRVLLAEKNLHPRFVKLDNYDFAAFPDYVLLIGDTALDYIRSNPGHEIFDLGAAWFELTGLPFVYAVWALRRGGDNSRLRRILRGARDFGLETLDSIIRNRTEYDYDFRKDYLGWHIHYHLGSDEKRGVARFVELLRKHQAAPVYSPNYVF